jgi:uncharacterized protein YndB with AHSA1/START domain
MRGDRRPRRGYLLLADISGYTAFLTATELDHAHEIIHELTSHIRERLTPPMSFVKLEGDAVFCYADEAALRDGEELVTLVEHCYFAFANRLDDMSRSATCDCTACARMGSLGLKFVVHFGEFIVDRDGGREDLAGPSVILAHRLLKNSVRTEHGSTGYLLLTEACLAQMPSAFRAASHTEDYESFGEITLAVHDLEPALSSMREARREFIAERDADFTTTIEVPIPPALAWKYLTDPIERLRWACRHFSKEPDPETLNAQGRRGKGTEAHCSHGPGIAFREYVDWRPFEYFTSHTMIPRVGRFGGHRPCVETVDLTPNGDEGTTIVGRMRLVDRGMPSRMAFRSQLPWIRVFYRHSAELLRAIVDDDVKSLAREQSAS